MLKYTLISAFDDDRFDPIVIDEVEELHVGISLLVNFESANNAYDWEVGTHGIDIEFEHKGKIYLHR